VVLIAHGEDRRQAYHGDRLAHYIDLGVSYVVRHPLSVQLLAQKVRTVLTRGDRIPNRERTLAQHLCQHLEFHPEVLVHGQRVAVLAGGFAAWLGCDEVLIRTVHAAGLVHDIGKITVPQDILAKPCCLGDEEYARMCLHADYGAKLCRLFCMPDRVSELVHGHHERHDGSGYPHGLAGRAIKLETAILSLADAFDALCEDRAYRAALNKREAMRVMNAEIERGLWEASLARRFFEYVERKVAIAL
jgi:putative nucleotidyltransferase with HDIG domain